MIGVNTSQAGSVTFCVAMSKMPDKGNWKGGFLLAHNLEVQ